MIAWWPNGLPMVGFCPSQIYPPYGRPPSWRFWPPIRGKAANITRELSHLGKVNEGLLKSLISGEEMDVNRKHKDPIKIKSRAKLVVATNELPTFSDTTEGIWRRMILMPMVVQIREQDQNRELAGLFNISSIPAVMYVPLNGKPQMSVGAMQKAAYVEMIHSILMIKDEAAK